MRKIYSFLQGTLCKKICALLLIFCCSVSVFANNVHNNQKNTNYPTIQAAVDDASINNVLVVSAGTYNESVIIRKSVSILGPNAAISPNTATRVAEALIIPQAPYFYRAFGVDPGVTATTINVIIKGFKIVGGTTGSPLHDYDIARTFKSVDILFEKNYISTGKDISGGSGNAWRNISIVDNKFDAISGSAMHMFSGTSVVISDNVINGASFSGIEIDLVQSVSVLRNTIKNTQRQGIQLANVISTATVSYNELDYTNQLPDATRGGIVLQDFSFSSSANITYNKVSNSYIGFAIPHQIGNSNNVHVNNNSFDATNVVKAILTTATVGSLDAECNWVGATTAAGVAARVAGNVDYTPWLMNGTDAQPTVKGFQPVANSCSGGVVAGCGPDGKNIVVCFYGCTLCVHPSLVPIVVALGGSVGACITHPSDDDDDHHYDGDDDDNHHSGDDDDDHNGSGHKSMAVGANDLLDIAIAEEKPLGVYPNPSTGVFTVKMQVNKVASDKAEIVILNGNGSIVEKRSVKVVANSTISEQFNFQSKPSGMYLVQLRCGEKMRAAKILIQR